MLAAKHPRQGDRIAAALLQTQEGLPLGTLCVLDYKPRELTDLQRDALRVLAKQVMTQLDLRKALKRQELLSKEIDHRVKNSLASVAAMVGMQITRAGDPALRTGLESVQQRIRTISLLHEELYRGNGEDDVDLGRYLTTLEAMLEEGAPAGVRVEIEADAVVVKPGVASAVGAVASEFVMNAMKHAFPEGRSGLVTVSLRQVGTRVELVCRDDGVGAGEIGPSKAGLGIRLIRAYAAQLGGEAVFSSADPGVELRVSFPRT